MTSWTFSSRALHGALTRKLICLDWLSATSAPSTLQEVMRLLHTRGLSWSDTMVPTLFCKAMKDGMRVRRVKSWSMSSAGGGSTRTGLVLWWMRFRRPCPCQKQLELVGRCVVSIE
ncbi:unnamed protein product [Symbiodinium pilosum]|uniref:Uncharacterized protein n=1 Tax=Symbiodinium pilosum TaxID=2952 RepID=A0A812PH23_SYMPI|nr:unnamed protein product [Symbiodinium pilosum]